MAREKDFTSSFNIIQSCLVQYVLSRETFDATDLGFEYRKTRAWSAGSALEGYEHLMKRGTPESPLNLYAPDATLSVSIVDVRQLSEGIALVRFQTHLQYGSGTLGRVISWVAAINYSFASRKSTRTYDLTNPTGFVVTRYERDRGVSLAESPQKTAIVTPPLRTSITPVQSTYPTPTSTIPHAQDPAGSAPPTEQAATIDLSSSTGGAQYPESPDPEVNLTIPTNNYPTSNVRGP